MDSVITAIVNNGLGVGSFIAFIYFINIYLSKMNTTLSDVAKTLVLIQNNLDNLSERVSDIESKVNKQC